MRILKIWARMPVTTTGVERQDTGFYVGLSPAIDKIGAESELSPLEMKCM